MSPKKHRKNRGKNFTRFEEMTLIKLKKAYKYILDNDNSDAEIWKRKKEAWAEVEQQFALQAGVHLSRQALRDKYRSMKIKLKLGESTQKSSISPVPDKHRNPTENNAIITETVPIKSEVFEIIEIGEPCIQDSKCPFVEENESFVPKLLKKKQHKIQTSRKPINRKRNLEEERIVLIKLQQKFYKDEIIRATEMHHMKMERIELKKELLEIEIKLRADAEQPYIKLEEDSP